MPSFFHHHNLISLVIEDIGLLLRSHKAGVVLNIFNQIDTMDLGWGLECNLLEGRDKSGLSP